MEQMYIKRNLYVKLIINYIVIIHFNSEPTDNSSFFSPSQPCHYSNDWLISSFDQHRRLPWCLLYRQVLLLPQPSQWLVSAQFNPGRSDSQYISQPASLGFVPVAIHFDLFGTLVRLGGNATADQVAHASNQARSKDEPEICTYEWESSRTRVSGASES